MAATANDVVTAAYQRNTVYGSADAIPPEDVTMSLAVLNDILNGVNANGTSVLETVALAINDVVPVADQNLDDLKWFLARRLAAAHGKQIQGDALAMARQGEERFKAAYIKVYGARPDAGLGNMPSRRRWGAVGTQIP